MPLRSIPISPTTPVPPLKKLKTALVSKNRLLVLEITKKLYSHLAKNGQISQRRIAYCRDCLGRKCSVTLWSNHQNAQNLDMFRRCGSAIPSSRLVISLESCKPWGQAGNVNLTKESVVNFEDSTGSIVKQRSGKIESISNCYYCLACRQLVQPKSIADQMLVMAWV